MWPVCDAGRSRSNCVASTRQVGQRDTARPPAPTALTSVARRDEYPYSNKHILTLATALSQTYLLPKCKCEPNRVIDSALPLYYLQSHILVCTLFSLVRLFCTVFFHVSNCYCVFFITTRIFTYL